MAYAAGSYISLGGMMSVVSVTSWLNTRWILSALLALHISSIFGQIKINAESTEPYLLFANLHSIRRINLNGSRFETLIYSNDSHAVGLDYDLRRGYMFWTEKRRKVIMKAHLDGSEPTTLVTTDVGSSDGLAWDWINKKLYWTNPDNETIEVYDPNTTYRKVLAKTGPGSSPRAIVVDPSKGWLYWSDWGREPKIVRTSMDGNISTVLHNTSLEWPNALTLDIDNQTLYWIDGILDQIETSNANGCGRKVLTRQNISRPFAVSYFRNQLYWSDWSRNTIRTVSLKMPNSVTFVNSNNRLVDDPVGIEVVTAARQPQDIANPCAIDNGGCTHLCLLSAVGPAGYCCACPEGIDPSECSPVCPAPQPSTATPGATTFVPSSPTPTPGPSNMTAYCLRGGTCEIAGFSVFCNCVGGYIGIGNNVVIYANNVAASSVPAAVFVGVVGGLIMVIFLMLFFMMCVIGIVKQQRNKDGEESISSSSPAHFKRTTDTPPSISEPEYWSIKGNSPCPRPRAAYLTNKRSLNHYVVNTSSATSSQYQDIKESLESERRSKIVTL